MHKMDSTPKIVTIVGMVLEALGALGMFFGAYILGTFMSREFFLELDPTIPLDELDFIINLYGTIASVLTVVGSILIIIFLVNVFLFSSLIRGKFSEETARKIYIYQFVWGIFNVLFNTITGILYIVSGYSGMKGIKEEKEVREGI